MDGTPLPVLLHPLCVYIHPSGQFSHILIVLSGKGQRPGLRTLIFKFIFICSINVKLLHFWYFIAINATYPIY